MFVLPLTVPAGRDRLRVHSHLHCLLYQLPSSISSGPKHRLDRVNMGNTTYHVEPVGIFPLVKTAVGVNTDRRMVFGSEQMVSRSVLAEAMTDTLFD